MTKSTRPHPQLPRLKVVSAPTSARQVDFGPDYRWQHGLRGLHVTETPGVAAACVLTECRLDELKMAGILTPAQADAGQKFRQDYLGSGVEKRIISSYQPVRGHDNGGYSEPDRTPAQEESYARWRAALRQIPLSCRAAVLSVCCHDEMPEIKYLKVLRAGLDQLHAWHLRGGEGHE